MTTQPPSGEQFEIRFGNQRAVATEVGGALRQYESDGRQLLDGYAEDEWCTGGRGQTLAPWPNRIQDGKYAFAGKSFQLALSDPEKHNAIHGLVRWANWSRVASAPDQVTLGVTLHPQPGYWFALRLENTYALSAGGLKVTTRATNLGAAPCPYGTGAHPYLSIGENVDAASVRAPGRRFLPTDARGIPTGVQPVEGTPFDFRKTKSLRGLAVDNGFTDLERAADGRAWVELSGGAGPVSLWLDQSYPYVQLFTGDTLDNPRYRRSGLAVEPMTCPPNAFQTGQDVIALPPGQTVESAWGIVAGTPL